MITITMGTDEFILFIRKNTKSTTTNDVLSKEIWKWIKKNSYKPKQVIIDQPCYWGSEGSFIGKNNLPPIATQFEFEIGILPELYLFLLTL
jgi:hypothetical protein